MLRDLLEDIIAFIKTRTFILGVIFVFMIGILIHRLFDLQIVNGEEYLNTFTYRIQKDMEIQSPRGTIYSADGVAIASNKLSYSVVIEDSTVLKDNLTRNTMVAKLVHYVESTGNKIIYNIPIEIGDDGNLRFNSGENTVIRFKKDVYSTETLTDQQKAATAQDVYEYMRSKNLFNLDESYSTEDALKILAVRFDLYMKRYEKYLSVTVAEDVNDALIAAVKENAEVLPGVSVEQAYTRVYPDSKYFSNITGYVGSISEQEIADYKSQGNTSYSQNDQVGKTGIEAYFESSLKGTKGSQKLYVNSLGSVLEVAEREEAIPGNDVYLTIDASLQKTAYDMLEERIAGILLTYMTEAEVINRKETLIPVRDFYFALIDNNVINLSNLSADTATDGEKAFWQKYIDYETVAMNMFREQLNTVKNDLSNEYAEYISLAYTMLRDNNVLSVSALDDGDETLSKWNSGEISMAELLRYAITKDIIGVSYLDLSANYLGTDEIYEALISYIVDNLPRNTEFEKRAMYYMLDDGYITGKEICLLLYEQHIFEHDSDYEGLVNDTLTGYQFMYNKVYHLEITPAMLALPPCSGAYVLTDVHTGAVKALVSYPGYDANQINNMTYFSNLVNSDAAPFYNRATQQALAPGSTFKPISAIAGLEEGVIDGDTYIHDDVTYTKTFPSANCWNSNGHGTINVVDAIRVSCNFFFYEVGYRLGSANNTQAMSDAEGVEKLAKYAKLFGLDSVTGLELTETAPHISDEGAVRSAIGQGTNAYTPAQMARYVATVANYGTLYKLTLFDKIVDSNNEVIQQNEPVQTGTVEIAQSTWDMVHEGMYEVCNVSSYNLKMGNLGVIMSGKSGTAQESEKRPNHGWFVGYAPYDNPEVAATLSIPNGHGSSALLDLYADLMCYYFGVPGNEKSAQSDTTQRTASLPDVSIESD